MGRKKLGKEGKTKMVLFRLTPADFKLLRKNKINSGDVIRSTLREISFEGNHPSTYEKNLKKSIEKGKEGYKK